MYNKFKDHLLDEIENTKKSGLYKSERIIKYTVVMTLYNTLYNDIVYY